MPPNMPPVPALVRIAFALIVLLLGGEPFGAFAVPTPPDSIDTLDAARPMVYSGQEGELEVAVPQRAGARVTVDGMLDEAVWQEAAVLNGFSQYEPIEGRPSTEATQIRIFYTSDAIYFGVEAFDRRPDRVLARLGERD